MKSAITATALSVMAAGARGFYLLVKILPFGGQDTT